MGQQDERGWDLRADGSRKGYGFLGLLKRPDGGVTSEISMGVNINGQEVEIPTIVPTLTPREVTFLLNMNVGKDRMPDSIVQKAVDYAHVRMAAKKSPFAQSGEERHDIYPQFQRAPTDIELPNQSGVMDPRLLKGVIK